MAGNLYEQGYYETGTASVTQGQTVVTGQGTAWLQIVRPADDFGKHVGMPIPIASVDSDTQITLAYPWPGPTQAAAPYRVTFTPYHVAYRQALQEIGQLLSSGNVSALAGLTLAAGNYLRASGPGAFDAIDGKNLDALRGLAGANGTFPVFTGDGAMALANLADYAGTGDVKGPASSTDGNVALFDGATGKVLKQGGALGTAAFAATGDFATAAQGVKADNAQPALGFTPVNRAGDTMTGKLNRAVQPYINCVPAGDGNGYRPLTMLQNSGFSLSADNLHVVIPETGRYRISILALPKGLIDFRVPLTINGVEDYPRIRVLNSESCGSMSTVRQLSAGDILSFQVSMGTNHPDNSFQHLTVEMI